MTQSWRIFKTRYAGTAFDGEGARLYGGRWTSPGRPAVYTSESAALATLEILVHVQRYSTLTSYSLVSVSFPASQVTTISSTELPTSWRGSPAPTALQSIGDQWLDDGTYAVLEVPSAIVPTDHNYILNPTHPEFGTFTFSTPSAFALDPRLTGA